MPKQLRLIVAIPTANRPAYLHATVKSVIDQAKEFHHRVRIVASDMSEGTAPDGEPFAEKNRRLMGKLRATSAGNSIQLYYYGPGMPKPIEKLLKKTGETGAAVYGQFVPADGQWGAHRNRLTLLVAHHVGFDPNAAVLHLDDDMPLLGLAGGLDGMIRFPASQKRDAIGAFIQRYKAARAAGFFGYQAMLVGAEPGRVSEGRESTADNLSQVLARGSSFFGMGGGKIVDFAAAIHPYRPYGPREDMQHMFEIGQHFGILREDDPLLVGHPPRRRSSI